MARLFFSGQASRLGSVHIWKMRIGVGLPDREPWVLRFQAARTLSSPRRDKTGRAYKAVGAAEREGELLPAGR